MTMIVQTIQTTKHVITCDQATANVGSGGAVIKVHTPAVTFTVTTSEQAGEWEELFRLLRVKLGDGELAAKQQSQNARRELDAALNGTKGDQ